MKNTIEESKKIFANIVNEYKKEKPFEKLVGLDFLVSSSDCHGQIYYRCISKSVIKVILTEDVMNNPLLHIDETFVEGIGLEIPENGIDENFIEENDLITRFVNDYETNFGDYSSHFGCGEFDFEFQIAVMNGMEFYLFRITEDEMF